MGKVKTQMLDNIRAHKDKEHRGKKQCAAADIRRRGWDKTAPLAQRHISFQTRQDNLRVFWALHCIAGSCHQAQKER